jgi:hypothetical protein
MVLHSDEDDKTVAWCLYAVLVDTKERPHAKGIDLLLNQALCRLRQRALYLTDAYCREARIDDALSDEEFREEVALPGASASIRAFIAAFAKEWAEDLCRFDTKPGAVKRLGNS